jgi:hypothetical protein
MHILMPFLDLVRPFPLALKAQASATPVGGCFRDYFLTFALRARAADP